MSRSVPSGWGSRRPSHLSRLAAGVAAVAVAVAGIVLGGCSAPSSGTSASTTSPGKAPGTAGPGTTASSLPAAETTTTIRIAGYVTIDGRRVAVPDEITKPVQPGQDIGEQILITAKAIEPHLLFCETGHRLNFTNLTSVPQQLRFVNDGNWRSPVITPGATWHYTPRYGISYYYVTATGLQAVFQASKGISPDI